MDYRLMEGFGVNTHSFINSIHGLLDDEVIIGGKKHCHVMQDLYKVIAVGSYPELKLYVQASGFEALTMRITMTLINLMIQRYGQRIYCHCGR
ncbi:Catalase mono-functional hem-containing protein [Dioscorea alata]|uniref:Catalase mono-functional hem-containing protein n=1 Tax=Dioscorea alata TaxID=55571 RepID=A0ACB7V7J0_DIOAL|nr:Catalase mono-functional hem-containing protein [Dioscorea alata]